MIRLEQKDGRYAIYENGRQIGTAMLSDNPYHGRNCYVKLEMEQFDAGIAKGLFCALRRTAGRPLQMTVDFADTLLADFLTAGGFVCRRKCYEMDVCAENYIGPESTVRPEHTRQGTPDYDVCARLLYEYYTETHRGVNPWTAGFDTFIRCLPADVYCEKTDGRIVNMAFVEENEIAYVCSLDPPGFSVFASGLTALLFESYARISFEADDCDWAATALRAMFTDEEPAGVGTYIYGCVLIDFDE